MRPRTQLPISIRCPDWLAPEKVKVDGPKSLKIETQSPYLRLRGLAAGAKISEDDYAFSDWKPGQDYQAAK